MNYRNARYNQHGTIDVEIDHPVHGWITFTASPSDPEKYGRDLHAALIEADEVKPYQPPTTKRR